MNELASKIKSILEKAGVRHEFLELPEDISMDIKVHMKFHGNDLRYAMPNIVFKTEKGLIVAQKRGDTPIDNKKLKKLAGVQRLNLASEEDLRSLGLESGIVPPLGYRAPFYMDRKVLENEEIYTGTGDRLFALKISPKDLVKLNNPTIEDFTKATADQTGGRVLSGIRATGRLHLGNYLGAVKGMLALQADPRYETFYMVVDLHTMTTPFNKETLKQDAKNIIIDCLACGLDPQKSAIFLQSSVGDLHSELMFYFSTVVTVARMLHLPTYKEKVKQHPQNVTMALLYYPILMASDILIYKASQVPVGIDQEPHLEVAREIARKMNEKYGLDFPQPQRFATAGEYIPSLRGEGKMSKSVEGSYINLTDSRQTIKEKLAGVPTDSGSGKTVPTSGGVAVLLALVELFVGNRRTEELKNKYTTEGIRYSEIKTELAEAIYKELEPIQQRRAQLERDRDRVREVLEDGAARAREVASQTVKEVKQAMGLE